MQPRAKLAQSLVSRVAWGAVLSASIAALLTAAFTSLFAAYLLQRAEDRRISDAAKVLLVELRSGAPTAERIAAVVREESDETNHTGIVFAVYDARSRRLAGDSRVQGQAVDGCVSESARNVRTCRVSDGSGISVVAAAAHTEFAAGFALSALAALLVAVLLAWLVSRPISQRIVSPLSRLRARIGAVDLRTARHVELGETENIVEVDELRAAIAQLLERVSLALDQATRFASDAAHELRTPLATIRAELELLPEQDSEGVQRVAETVERLSVLVERLLILATPHSAVGADTAFETVSLRDVIEDVCAALPEVAQKRVTLALQTEGVLSGDSVLLRTMVSNVLSNALKFAANVEVSLTETAGYSTIVIADDGPGISQSDREHVFEPFYRTQDSRARRIAGHGLGLAIVAHIARAHGGSARVVDVPKGTTIELRFHSPSDA